MVRFGGCWAGWGICYVGSLGSEQSEPLRARDGILAAGARIRPENLVKKMH